ncbi:mCG146986 [Mus musculus]|nr:mCG146986 [Mus musculus]
MRKASSQERSACSQGSDVTHLLWHAPPAGIYINHFSTVGYSNQQKSENLETQ